MREKYKAWQVFIIIIGGLFFLYTNSSAHPGRTDSYGCHTCRTNCSSWGLSYGEYHCHRAKALPQPEPPVKSHIDGTTEPAPEYKSPINQNNLKANNLTAEVPKDEDGSLWGWIIGLGIIGYCFYYFKERKNK